MGFPAKPPTANQSRPSRRPSPDPLVTSRSRRLHHRTQAPSAHPSVACQLRPFQTHLRPWRPPSAPSPTITDSSSSPSSSTSLPIRPSLSQILDLARPAAPITSSPSAAHPLAPASRIHPPTRSASSTPGQQLRPSQATCPIQHESPSSIGSKSDAQHRLTPSSPSRIKQPIRRCPASMAHRSAMPSSHHEPTPTAILGSYPTSPHCKTPAMFYGINVWQSPDNELQLTIVKFNGRQANPELRLGTASGIRQDLFKVKFTYKRTCNGAFKGDHPRHIQGTESLGRLEKGSKQELGRGQAFWEVFIFILFYFKFNN